MLKAERVKAKMGMGKTAKVRFEEIKYRERVTKDGSGYFIGLDADKVVVDTVNEIADAQVAKNNQEDFQAVHCIDCIIAFFVACFNILFINETYIHQDESPRPASGISTARTEVPDEEDTEDNDLPGQVDNPDEDDEDPAAEGEEDMGEDDTSDDPPAEEDPAEDMEEDDQASEDMEEDPGMDQNI